jgi:hypothetical protein
LKIRNPVDPLFLSVGTIDFILRLPLAEVDMALAACEKNIKTHIDTIKVKLNNNAAIPPTVLRELSKGNSQKSRLMMRRIALLIESGDSSVMELLGKLMKVKPARPAGA